MTGRVLVAGIGNIFLGDDAFGVEVVRRLRDVEFPEHVTVQDFGIGAIHLAYELMNGYDLAVLVDAVPAGEQPGTVFVLEPDIEELPDDDQAALLHDAHGMGPESVLALVATLRQRLGVALGRVVIVGCEPARVEESMGLSAPVEAAIEPAVHAVLHLVAEPAQAAPEDPSRAAQAKRR